MMLSTGANHSEAAAPCVRNTFLLALAHRLAESARRGDPLSVILARVEEFQSLAERYGLQAGNEVLNAVGRLFIRSVRAMDWVARFDATTFAFLFPNTTYANALRIVERLRATVSAAGFAVDGTPVHVTLSLGTTELASGDTAEAILGRAEEALGAALQVGGNRLESRADGCGQETCMAQVRKGNVATCQNV